SHLFRRGKWTIEMLKELADNITLNQRRAYGVLLKYYLNPTHFFKYVQAVKAISAVELEQLVEAIPEDWLPDRLERQALVEFLTARCGKVDWVMRQLTDLIPDINRRSHLD
ncbi:MAG: HipA family kinase, partial [Sporomusa sp.]